MSKADDLIAAQKNRKTLLSEEMLAELTKLIEYNDGLPARDERRISARAAYSMVYEMGFQGGFGQFLNAVNTAFDRSRWGCA